METSAYLQHCTDDAVIDPCLSCISHGILFITDHLQPATGATLCAAIDPFWPWLCWAYEGQVSPGALPDWHLPSMMGESSICPTSSPMPSDCVRGMGIWRRSSRFPVLPVLCRRSCKYSLRRHNGRRRTLRAVQRIPSPPPMLAMPSVATPGQAARTNQLAAPAKAPGTALTSDPSLETFAALMMNLPGVDVLGPDWSEESAPPCSVAGLLAAHEQVRRGERAVCWRG